jgi:MATE family multidrug resistance protein
MITLAQRLRGHMEGDGGIRQLLAIALPMFISQAADTLMMFIDRLFLARVGKEHMAAAMSGGLTSFMVMTFFIGIIGYGNALVAQYLGSGRRDRCGLAGAQCLLLALASYPIVIVALRPLGQWLLRSAGHDALQAEQELIYFNVLVWFAFLPLLRAAMGSFFSGIGRTRIVMVANLAALLVNVILNYLLIFGKCGFPALGMRGAAYGTVIGNGVCVLLLAAAYFSARCRREYGTWAALRFERGMAGRLLHFGLPSGTEFFLNMTAFTLFVQFMHAYGRDVAAAVTITFNWDMVAFVPLIGVSIGTTSLVGRFMGAQRADIAERAAYSGLRATLCYTATILILFLAIPGTLVGLFTPSQTGLDYAAVYPRAVFMVRMASIYLISDAFMLVFGGALRGAGDTRWVMRTSVLFHWAFATVSWLLIKVAKVTPETTWIVVVFMIAAVGYIFFARFRGGAWKTLRVIETTPAPVDGAAADFPEARD